MLMQRGDWLAARPPRPSMLAPGLAAAVPVRAGILAQLAVPRLLSSAAMPCLGTALCCAASSPVAR